MTHDNVTDIERLRSIAGSLRRGRWLSNGEEARIEQAASTIATLRKQLDNAREALRFYAEPHAVPSEGPWGAASMDFGNVAREALKGPQ